jgi:hypothetical protein
LLYQLSVGAVGRASEVEMVALSARAVFEEIIDNDEAFQFFCSIAASGEAQGGWENSRIAALVPAAYQDLAPKITRHAPTRQTRPHLHRTAAPTRPFHRTGSARDRLHDAARKRGFGVAHEELRDNQPLSEAGHHHLPRAQPRHRTACRRTDADPAPLHHRSARVRPASG